ncbi:hypothetical protein AB0L41_49720 [Amycolatopsis mediterranei]|uniref:hypothetical protein n=1 Tax=Amycolatopsis mediterranei TaxID=33910 RepID=UPI00342B98DD
MTAQPDATAPSPRHSKGPRTEDGFVLTGVDAEGFRDADVLRGVVRHSSAERVASAVGEAAMAVRFVHEHLSPEA